MIPVLNQPGLNGHSELLPMSSVSALGLKWLRHDGNVKIVQQLVRHAMPRPVLWVYNPSDGPAKYVIPLLLRSGVRHIEPWNEAQTHDCSPEEYAALYNEVRAIAGTRARVYTSLSTWTDERWWLDAALKAGLKLDVLGFHAYLMPSMADLSKWIAQAKTYAAFHGNDVCITECGFPLTLGGKPYRETFGVTATVASLMSQALKIARAAGVGIGLYDGPNPSADEGTGLFDSNDGGRTWSVPNANYAALRATVV